MGQQQKEELKKTFEERNISIHNIIISSVECDTVNLMPLLGRKYNAVLPKTVESMDLETAKNYILTASFAYATRSCVCWLNKHIE